MRGCIGSEPFELRLEAFVTRCQPLLIGFEHSFAILSRHPDFHSLGGLYRPGLINLLQVTAELFYANRVRLFRSLRSIGIKQH